MTELPFLDYLPRLFTCMMEDTFTYDCREEEQTVRWPIVERVEAQMASAAVLDGQARLLAASRPGARLPRFKWFPGRFGLL